MAEFANLQNPEPIPKPPTAADTRVRYESLQFPAATGDGLGYMVRPTSPPSLRVEVANVVLIVDPPDTQLTRRDLITMSVHPAVAIEIVTGVPAMLAAAPPCPDGSTALAIVRVEPLAPCISREHLEEVRLWPSRPRRAARE